MNYDHSFTSFFPDLPFPQVREQSGFQRDPAIGLPESRPVTSKISKASFEEIFYVDKMLCILCNF